ncbi:MAG: hypothetical protein JXA97_00780 [Anaerolineales bacterium]|nr:hypothetical protein [Anaerolineales bacterium]
MNWIDCLRGDPFPWLLEEADPGARYLAMKSVPGLKPSSQKLNQARRSAHTDGPIASILSAMDAEGYWAAPGPGYLPKYRSTVWSLAALAQLGASQKEDVRISAACKYLLEHALMPDGQFTTNGVPSGTIDCLQGNLLAALLDLGCEDPQLETAFEWMARTVTGEGLASAVDRKASRRFYAGKIGPLFRCGANNKLACAWGAVKVMLAFGKLPPDRRTPLIQRAIDQGIDFLFSVDPAEADYPCGFSSKPSRNWWKFGFPVFYVTDILQIAETLGIHGYAGDPRLEHTKRMILEKQDADGRWKMEYSYDGKLWVNFGANGLTNKWVTIRTLRVLALLA